MQTLSSVIVSSCYNIVLRNIPTHPRFQGIILKKIIFTTLFLVLTIWSLLLSLLQHSPVPMLIE
jgi:hypothetical protein